MSERIDVQRSRASSAHRTRTGARARNGAVAKKGASTRVHPVMWSLLVLGASLAMLAAIGAGMFRVQHVRVVGKALPRAEIIQRSGLLGENIFTVQSDEVVSRLAGVGIVAVRRVDVSFPDQVTIYARRRIAMVAWQRGHSLYLLDPDGHVIQQVRAAKLPIIRSGPEGGKLGPGVVTAVREAVRLLPTAPRGAIAGFTFGPVHGLIIDGVAGWHARVGFGSPETMVTRLATLVDLLRRLQDQPLRPWIVLDTPSPYMGDAP